LAIFCKLEFCVILLPAFNTIECLCRRPVAVDVVWQSSSYSFQRRGPERYHNCIWLVTSLVQFSVIQNSHFKRWIGHWGSFKVIQGHPYCCR